MRVVTGVYVCVLNVFGCVCVCVCVLVKYVFVFACVCVFTLLSCCTQESATPAALRLLQRHQLGDGGIVSR